MTIILENYAVPEKGAVEICVNVSFEIKVTAREAQRKVDRWLLEYVSYMMGADPPTLVIGERVVWRVPAYISFPDLGKWGVVGTVEVDVKTGGMGDLAARKEEIVRYLEEEVRPRLPPYKRRVREVPPEFVPKHVPPAPVLVLPDDEEDAGPAVSEEL